jgi:hypothetical protein
MMSATRSLSFRRDTDDTMVTLMTIGLLIVVVLAAIGIWIWMHQPFYYDGFVKGDFKVVATSTYQEYRSHLNCSTSTDSNGNSRTSCNTSWSWDTMYQLQNTRFDRKAETLDCHYDRVVDGKNSRWLPCQVDRWMLISYHNKEEAKEGWCVFNDPSWKWIERNSKLTISENRAYEVHCQ